MRPSLTQDLLLTQSTALSSNRHQELKSASPLCDRRSTIVISPIPIKELSQSNLAKRKYFPQLHLSIHINWSMKSFQQMSAHIVYYIQHDSPPSPILPRWLAGPNPISISTCSKSSGRSTNAFAFSFNFCSKISTELEITCARAWASPQTSFLLSYTYPILVVPEQRHLHEVKRSKYVGKTDEFLRHRGSGVSICSLKIYHYFNLITEDTYEWKRTLGRHRIPLYPRRVVHQ